MTTKPTIEEAAGRVISLEAELEAAGNAATAGSELAWTRAMLHDWVETVVGAVVSPGVGRVTLIHANGAQSKIASPELPFRLTRPVSFAPPE
jgi:hypothetical protein